MLRPKFNSPADEHKNNTAVSRDRVAGVTNTSFNPILYLLYKPSISVTVSGGQGPNSINRQAVQTVTLRSNEVLDACADTVNSCHQ